jgi:hypothetical protein
VLHPAQGHAYADNGQGGGQGRRFTIQKSIRNMHISKGFAPVGKRYLKWEKLQMAWRTF